MSGEKSELCFAPGSIIDERFKILRRIAGGTMGTVYACDHLLLPGRRIALKVLRKELARDKTHLERFRNEVEVSYDVTHPNVVRAYEFICRPELVAYAMEYVDGGDLSALAEKKSRVSLVRAVEITRQICLGLQAIHEAGIIHRDLKPSNILLTTDGKIKVSDFGIARIAFGRRLTENGAVLGSIDYLSPEYIRDGELDIRCDIYGVGMLAYRLVSPQPPFSAPSVIECLRLRTSGDPPPPSTFRAECPEQLDRLILKAMARDPLRRYQNTEELLADLDAVKSLLRDSHEKAESRTAPRNRAADQKDEHPPAAPQKMPLPPRPPVQPQPAAARPASRAFSPAAFGALVLTATLGLGLILQPPRLEVSAPPIKRAAFQPTARARLKPAVVSDKAISHPSASEDLVHEIRFSGETLAIIADWYTGDLNNWRAVSAANPEKDLKSLDIGDKVSIPARLLEKFSPMPQSHIVAVRRKVKAAPRRQL